MNKNKRIFIIIIISMTVLIFAVGIAYGFDFNIRYRFSSILKVNEEVTDNPAEGTHEVYYYVAKPTNFTEEDWLSTFAGGIDEEIVLGVGKLIYDNNFDNTELFIDLKSQREEITLIANGAYYEYYGGTERIKRKVVNFLTGKRLEGNEVVKDYSEGKIKIILIIDYNEEGIGTPRALLTSNGSENDNPKENYYTLEIKE